MSDAQRARRLVAAGALAVAGGIALAGTASPTGGGGVVVAGWLLFVWAIHSYGRAR